MTSIEEGVVLEHLASAYNAFVKLPVQHPMEADEFCRAIHAAQALIAVRVARRSDPIIWPSHSG